MNKDLTIKDRLIILSILPQENDIATLKIIRDLQNKLGITEEEYKEVELTIKDGVYSWNTDKDKPKGYDLGEKSIDIIKDSFNLKDKQKKITLEMIDTYDLFNN
jgi:hypothetical protein